MDENEEEMVGGAADASQTPTAKGNANPTSNLVSGAFNAEDNEMEEEGEESPDASSSVAPEVVGASSKDVPPSAASGAGRSNLQKGNQQQGTRAEWGSAIKGLNLNPPQPRSYQDSNLGGQQRTADHQDRQQYVARDTQQRQNEEFAKRHTSSSSSSSSSRLGSIRGWQDRIKGNLPPHLEDRQRREQAASTHAQQSGEHAGPDFNQNNEDDEREGCGDTDIEHQAHSWLPDADIKALESLSNYSADSLIEEMGSPGELQFLVDEWELEDETQVERISRVFKHIDESNGVVATAIYNRIVSGGYVNVPDIVKIATMRLIYQLPAKQQIDVGLRIMERNHHHLHNSGVGEQIRQSLASTPDVTPASSATKRAADGREAAPNKVPSVQEQSKASSLPQLPGTRVRERDAVAPASMSIT